MACSLPKQTIRRHSRRDGIHGFSWVGAIRSVGSMLYEARDILLIPIIETLKVVIIESIVVSCIITLAKRKWKFGYERLKTFDQEPNYWFVTAKGIGRT